MCSGSSSSRGHPRLLDNGCLDPTPDRTKGNRWMAPRISFFINSPKVILLYLKSIVSYSWKPVLSPGVSHYMKINILLENHLLDSGILQRISQNPIYSLWESVFGWKFLMSAPSTKSENNTYYQNCKASPASTLVSHTPPRCLGQQSQERSFHPSGGPTPLQSWATFLQRCSKLQR